MNDFLPIPVAVLGASGVVGQKAIALLDQHPLFVVAEVSASDEREGKLYGEEVIWKEPYKLSSEISSLRFTPIENIQSSYILSALPASVAKEKELFLAKKGAFVFSNASSFRMDPKIPLLIPEINIEHISLIDRQKTQGKIICNSNCTTAFIALALKPLMKLGDLKQVGLVTMQAISGAGHLGIDPLEIMGNVIPYIKGEEEKIQQETLRILGGIDEPLSLDMMVQVHRVSVAHGHTIALQLQFENEIDPKQVLEVYETANLQFPGLYQLYAQIDRPQPALDIGPFDFNVHIGKIKRGSSKTTLSLVAMGHNLVRGAAGASIKNMEAALEYEKRAVCL